MLPQTRRRRVSFVLTPLIDVIFLLLLFFMLSSEVAPYSLLPLSDVASGREETAAPPPEPSSPRLPLAVRVLHGQVRIGNEAIPFAELEEAVRGLRREGSEAYLLIPTASATVQDVVSALEALKKASVASVTLLNAESARP